MCETERKLSDTLNDRFRIYFPTAETVAKSHGGIGVWNLPRLLYLCVKKLLPDYQLT